MSQLSKHFQSNEFACNCGECGGRSFVDRRLLNALEELRTLVNKSIHIQTGGGFRCPKHSQEKDGAKNSQHLYGKAADITIAGMTVPQMYEAAMQVNAFFDGGIGIYPNNGFIHVDVRIVKARWARIKKKKKDVYVSIQEGLNAI